MYPYLAVPQCCCSFQGQLTQCCAGHKTSPFFIVLFPITDWFACVCVFVHKRLRVWVYMTRQSRWCAANPLQLVSSTEEDPSMNPLMFMSLYMQNTLKCKLVKVSHFARSYKSDDVTSSQCHLFSTACFSYSWASNRQQHQSHKWEFPYTRFKMNVLPTASGLRKLTSHEYFFSCIFAENNGGQCVTRGKSLNVKCYL